MTTAPAWPTTGPPTPDHGPDGPPVGPHAAAALEVPDTALTVDLLDDVVATLAAHGEHPPRDTVAAWLDRLLADADA